MLYAGNKTDQIFNFQLRISQQKGDKRIGQLSYYIRIAGSYHPNNVLLILFVGEHLFKGVYKIDHSYNSLEP